METPDFSHLYTSSNHEFSSVYEPSNDSFLFLDALETELETICSIKPTTLLEIGSGSGIISSFLSKALKEKNLQLFVLCSDINIAACKSTKIMHSKNQELCSESYGVDIINCDLANPMLNKMKYKVDIILFNPPYVPTPSEEIATYYHLEAAAWAGGINGTEVTYRFLKQALTLLSDNGFLYLLIVKENNLDEIIQFVQDNNTNKNKELKVNIVMSRKCRNEYLSIIKFY